MPKKLEITNISDAIFGRLFVKIQDIILTSGIPDFEMVCIENEKGQDIGYEFELKFNA